MKTKNTYLDFYKTVLEKVRFDQQLFWKEYHKAVRVLNDHEKQDLNNWICQQYNELN